MSSLTSTVAGRHLTTKVTSLLTNEEKRAYRQNNSYRKSGEAIARTLADLKGPVMKFGQMASIQSGFLPAALTEPLTTLRQDANPEPFDVIRHQIETELNAPLAERFAHVDPIPVAVASVGQVHRATTLDGITVAVKVQYPNMEKCVAADVSSLTMLLKTMGVASGQKNGLRNLAAEFQLNLQRELDFNLEAQNQMLLRAFHQKHHPFVTIPEVLPQLSTKRVLTSVFVSGDSLEMAAAYPLPVKDKIGERMLRMLYDQIFHAGMLHGDPNPSNYTFTKDGGIVLYDFGCIKNFEPDEVFAIRHLLRGFLNDDQAMVLDGLRQIGLLPGDAPPPDEDFFAILRDMMAEPLHPTLPFDVGRSDMHLKAMAYAARFRKYRRQLIIPHRLLILQRVNVGCYGILKKLSSTIRVRKIIEETLSQTEEYQPLSDTGDS